jgi:hypothetical protein
MVGNSQMDRSLTVVASASLCCLFVALVPRFLALIFFFN